MKNLFFLLGFGLSVGCLSAMSIEEAKNKCLELGFKSDTEQLGNCVLKLSKQETDKNFSSSETNNKKPPSSLVRVITTKSFKDCDECPEMVEIPSGNFLMGSSYPVQDPFSNKKTVTVGGDSERPQHRVTLQSFSIGKYEVTQEQWYSMMGENPSNFKGRKFPVEQVSWDDAQSYLKKLSKKTGKNYRLPSEAEWEYACRASEAHEYCGGYSSDAVGWSIVNNPKSTHEVGGLQSNAWGLYDMSGNVWEWTQDCWNRNYEGAPVDGSAWEKGNCNVRVRRGGSWNLYPEDMRSAARDKLLIDVSHFNIGFRVARSP